MNDWWKNSRLPNIVKTEVIQKRGTPKWIPLSKQAFQVRGHCCNLGHLFWAKQGAKGDINEDWKINWYSIIWVYCRILRFIVEHKISVLVYWKTAWSYDNLPQIYFHSSLQHYPCVFSSITPQKWPTAIHSDRSYQEKATWKAPVHHITLPSYLWWEM